MVRNQKSVISTSHLSLTTPNTRMNVVSFQFCLLQRFSFTTSQHCAHAPVRFRHTNGLVRVRKRCLPSNILVTANRAGEVLTTNVVKHLNAASDLPSLSSITPSQPLSIKINVGN